MVVHNDFSMHFTKHDVPIFYTPGSNATSLLNDALCKKDIQSANAAHGFRADICEICC